MAVNLNSVGIQTTALSLCETVEYEQRTEEVVVQDCDSGFGAAEAIDPMIEFSIKGSGDLPAGIVIGGDGGSNMDITGVNDGAGTETRIITSIRESESSDQFNTWEASGVYYPNT